MVERILIATDGSDGAKQAARHATLLAKAYDATVHALHVVPSRTLTLLRETVGRADDLESLGQEPIDAVAPLVTEHDVPLVTAIERGDPAETMLQYIETNDVDLAVVGTHGRTGLPRYLFGSVAETIIRTAPVPVLATRASGHAEPYQNILVPVSILDDAGGAPEEAIDLARRFDATLHLVHVVDRRDLATTYDKGPARTDVEAALEKRGQDVVDEAVKSLQRRDVDVTTHLTSGIPVSKLRQYADDAEIDLVVMRTHGRTGSERFLLGSVTENLLRSVSTPVLTVHTDD